VTVTNTLTVNEHVERVLSAQSVGLGLFALKTLRAHGLNRDCLHNVFNAVILPKLTYAVCAWIGFTRAAERERIEAFVRCCKRSELCLCSAKTKFLQKSVNFMTISYLATSYVIHVISSTNYFRQSQTTQT